MTFWPTRRGLSLRVSLLLYLVFPLISVLAFAGYFSLERLEQEVEEKMQEDIELIARAIRGPLEYSLEQGREGSLTQAVASVFRFGRVYGVYVYDKEGRRIAASGPREPAVGTRHLAELAAGGDRRGEYQETGNQQVYSYFVPLSDSVGRNTGLLQLTREGSDFQLYIQEVRRQALVLLVLLSALLLGIVVYGHHRVIGRNLGLLVRGMARIEGGDRSHRAGSCGPREMRQLAEGMNAMLDSIERSERAIEKQRLEQVHLERRLQQSQKMAAIGQLGAGVAHELGTPLSVVSGKAQRMLRKKSDLSEPVVKAFREIRDAVQRMEHIVRQLLDFGRGNRLRTRPMALDDIADCATSQIRDESGRKGIALVLEGPRPAPTLPVDKVRMEQALVNLLRNAVQAAPRGGEVRLEWFVDERGRGFRVADDGPSVPEEFHARVFEPFFTTKAVDQGTGLGLAVALAAVRDHGGRLDIGRSELGGALFSITFEMTEHPDDCS